MINSRQRHALLYRLVVTKRFQFRWERYKFDSDTRLLLAFPHSSVVITQQPKPLHFNSLFNSTLTPVGVEGRANEALLRFIAGTYKVPAINVTLKQGGQSRHKRREVRGSLVNPASLLA